METVLILVIAFQIKHFVADYLIQMKFNHYFMRKFDHTGWIVPLAVHSLSHGILSFLILLCVASFPLALILGIADTVIHFIMDRIKASPDMLGRYSPDEPEYWQALGIDQMVHHLTHYGLIFIAIGL